MSKYQIQQSDIKYMSYVNTSFCVCLLFSNLIHDKTWIYSLHIYTFSKIGWGFIDNDLEQCEKGDIASCEIYIYQCSR
jgi:hypothetical protein